MNDDNRTQTVSFRCTEEENELIKQNATDAGVSKSNYIVNCCVAPKHFDVQRIIPLINKMYTYLNKADAKIISKKTALTECKKGLNKICQELN